MSDTEKVMQELAPLLPLLRQIERRLYAAIALHGYLSGRSADSRGATRETVAVGCVAYADALLAELERNVRSE